MKNYLSQLELNIKLWSGFQKHFCSFSSLHWLILVSFCVFFIQWSIILSFSIWTFLTNYKKWRKWKINTPMETTLFLLTFILSPLPGCFSSHVLLSCWDQCWQSWTQPNSWFATEKNGELCTWFDKMEFCFLFFPFVEELYPPLL